MEWFEALLLGVVQGVTEFLPVSSSGHLQIVNFLTGHEIGEENLMFTVALHAATVCSTIVVFRKDILKLLEGFFKFKWNEEMEYISKILLSMIPILIVGLFFKDFVEEIFSSITVVGVCLLITALILATSDFISRKRYYPISNTPLESTPLSKVEERVPRSHITPVEDKHSESSATNEAEESAHNTDSTSNEECHCEKSKRTIKEKISFRDAFIIGIAQAVAVLPGISRSGATIATGLMLGNRKDRIAEFSFLMVLIPIIGEALLDLKDGGFTAAGIEPPNLAIGFISAFICGYAACAWMVRLVRNSRLIYFACYCAVVGVIILLTQIL